jgi:hypothetical protein
MRNAYVYSTWAVNVMEPSIASQAYHKAAVHMRTKAIGLVFFLMVSLVTVLNLGTILVFQFIKSRLVRMLYSNSLQSNTCD